MLCMAQYLPVHETAAAFHTEGLRLATKVGDFAGAHAHFAAGLEILEPEDHSRADVVVQEARIIRDDGYTYVRSAVAARDPTAFVDAEEQLARSADMTLPLIGGIRPSFIGLIR